jgi:type I protein arginine methyltransferase
MIEGLYDSLEIHRTMLRDTVRNEAYRTALEEAVRPGDVVLDVGAGTGILSLLAAQAGAAHVYAVERSSVARLAADLAARNDMAERITVFHDDVERVRLPSRVDVIVSEWLGVYAVDENLLAPVLTARDRWLAPGGRLLPDRVVSYLAPVWVEPVEYLRSAPYGLDLGPIASDCRDEIAWPRRGLAPEDIAAEAFPLWTIHLERFPTWQARLPFQAAPSFEIEEAGAVNALAAWFEAGFGESVTLSNAPGAPRTHWNQFVFPLDRRYDVEPGDRIDARFSCIPAGPGYCHHAWSVSAAGRAWEHHDTRLGAGPAWREL